MDINLGTFDYGQNPTAEYSQDDEQILAQKRAYIEQQIETRRRQILTHMSNLDESQTRLKLLNKH